MQFSLCFSGNVPVSPLVEKPLYTGEKSNRYHLDLFLLAYFHGIRRNGGAFGAHPQEVGNVTL